MIRVKTLKKLVEIAEDFANGKISRAEDIVDRYGVSFRTAYDYWNTLMALREVFLKDIEERIRGLEGKMLDLRLKVEELRTPELDKELTRIKAELDELRKKRLGF